VRSLSFRPQREQLSGRARLDIGEASLLAVLALAVAAIVPSLTNAKVAWVILRSGGDDVPGGPTS
jgi:hypothetical protein